MGEAPAGHPPEVRHPARNPDRVPIRELLNLHPSRFLPPSAKAVGERLFIGYGRYSTLEKQDENSLRRQRDNCEKVWTQPGHGFHLWFEDAGVTGTTKRRRGLQAALAEARRRKAKGFVVEDVDRLSRSLAHLLEFYEELTHLGMELWDCKNGRLDFLKVYTLGLLAQLGRDRIIETTVGGKIKAVEQGRILTKPIFGHMYHRFDRRIRLVDPELAPIVEWIFEQVAAGATLWRVAKDLCARQPGKMPRSPLSRARKPKIEYDTAFVKRTIRNFLYMGIHLYNQTEVEKDFETRAVKGKRKRPVEDIIPVAVPHLAIVTSTLWARANLALDKRQGVRSAGGDQRTASPLGGRVFCSCGSPLKRHGVDTRYLACRDHLENPGGLKCAAAEHWPLPWVEENVFGCVAAVLGSSKDASFRSHVGRSVAAAQADEQSRRAGIETRLRQIEVDKRRLATPEAVEGYAPATLVRWRSELEADADALRTSLSRLGCPGEFDGIAAELGTVAKGVRAMAKRVPFVAANAEDQALVAGFRAIVGRVGLTLVAPGLARFDLQLGGPLRVEAEAPVGDQLELALDWDGRAAAAGTYAIAFEARLPEAADIREARRIEAARQLEALARSGVHDVGDKAWRVISPLIRGIDFKDAAGGMAPRTLFDGLSFALQTGTGLKSLPHRYRGRESFARLLSRVATCGALDRIVAALKASCPEAIAGWDLGRLGGTRLRLSKSAERARLAEPERTLDQDDVDKLLDAAASELSELAKRRMSAVAHAIGGHRGRAAERFGFTPSYVSILKTDYRRGGLDALRPRRQASRKSLTQAMVEDVGRRMDEGFDPAFPDVELSWPRVAAYCERVHSVDLTTARIARVLRAAGHSIRVSVAARRMRSAGPSATAGDEGPSAKVPVARRPRRGGAC